MNEQSCMLSPCLGPPSSLFPVQSSLTLPLSEHQWGRGATRRLNCWDLGQAPELGGWRVLFSHTLALWHFPEEFILQVPPWLPSQIWEPSAALRWGKITVFSCSDYKQLIRVSLLWLFKSSGNGKKKDKSHLFLYFSEGRWVDGKGRPLRPKRQVNFCHLWRLGLESHVSMRGALCCGAENLWGQDLPLAGCKCSSL